ncbi:hypothetical protein Hanom_Chr07g00616791 [Helianthus anomalus]
MVLKKLRFWFVKDEKKKRTPKVSTPKVVIKGNNVNICVAETKKKKSPPRLIDKSVIPPTDVIKEGVDLLKMSFADHEKLSTAQGTQGDQEAEKIAENIKAGGEGVKETFVEGQVHTDSSETESDFDLTKIAPTPYVSGKQKLKKLPKKKKA